MDPWIVAVMVAVMIAGACLIIVLAPDPLQGEDDDGRQP